MNFIQILYYNLEGSALYIQNKIWGRHYNESTGFKFITLSTTLIILIWSYLAVKHYHLHIAIVVLIGIIPFLCWGAYSLSNLSKNSSDRKIKDFSTLNTYIRWIYLIYTVTLMLILPIVIISVLIFNK
jgi:hypothetical protein